MNCAGFTISVMKWGRLARVGVKLLPGPNLTSKCCRAPVPSSRWLAIRPDLLAARFPKTQNCVLPDRHQRSAVVDKGEPGEAAARVPQRHRLFAGFHVEELECRVGADGCHPVAARREDPIHH